MSSVTSINPDLLSILAALIAIIISQSRNADELNTLGNFIVSVGSLILTEAAQLAAQTSIEDNADEIKNIHQQMEHLQRQLEKLQSRYN